MTGRRVTMVLGFVAWVYCWYLIRGVRLEFQAGDLGQMPPWLIALMPIASTALIAASISAGMRLRAWPHLSVGSAILLLVFVFLGQFAVMRHPSLRLSPSVVDAFQAAFRVRSSLEVAIFIAAIPTLLILAGLTGFVGNRLDARTTEAISG